MRVPTPNAAFRSGAEQREVPSKDDINLERNQFGGKSGEPLEPSLGISVVDHEVVALDVTGVTQSLQEGLSQGAVAAAGLGTR